MKNSVAIKEFVLKNAAFLRFSCVCNDMCVFLYILEKCNLEI